MRESDCNKSSHISQRHPHRLMANSCFVSLFRFQPHPLNKTCTRDIVCVIHLQHECGSAARQMSTFPAHLFLNVYSNTNGVDKKQTNNQIKFRLTLAINWSSELNSYWQVRSCQLPASSCKFHFFSSGLRMFKKIYKSQDASYE